MIRIVFYSKNGHAYDSISTEINIQYSEIAKKFDCEWIEELIIETKEVITQRGIKKYNKIWLPDMQKYAVIDPKE